MTDTEIASFNSEGSLFVHFDGPEPDLLVYNARLFAQLRVLDIVRETLPLYNSLHHTNFTIEECGVNLMVDMNGDLISTETESILPPGPNHEVVVILPGPVPPLGVVSPDIAQVAIRNGRFFLEQNHCRVAAQFFDMAGSVGCAVLRKMISDFGDDRALECLRLAFDANVESKPVVNVAKSDEELLREIGTMSMGSSESEVLLLALAQCQPVLALKLALRDSELYSVLPRLCMDVPGIIDVLAELMDRLEMDSEAKARVADFLIQRGLISEGVRIGYNLDVLRSSSSATLGARKLWFLFLNGDFGALYLSLQWFFTKYSTQTLGSASMAMFQDCIYGIRPMTKRTRTRIAGVPDRLAADRIPYFTAICLAGCFLFLQGFIEEYTEIRLMLDPETKYSFDGCSEAESRRLELELYKSTSLIHGARRTVKKSCTLCAIGDETVISLAYSPSKASGCDSTVARPISGLSIWALRPRKRNLLSAAFWNQLKYCQDYRAVAIVIGKYDLITSLPHVLQSGRCTGVKRALALFAEAYKTVIAEIQQLYPGLHVFIGSITIGPEHGVPLAQRDALHEALRSVMPEGVGFLW
jgi:hypothetical protein